MTNRIVLNNVDHGDLTVRPRFGAAFGDQVNSVRLFPTEYDAASREYAILFRQDTESAQTFAVALLGLDANENLFLEGACWNARYIPAVQSRGPFSIGLQRNDDGSPSEALIHVDLDDPRVDRGAEKGHPVFLAQGGNSPFLDSVVTVLRTISEGLEVEPAMIAAFTEFELIQPVKLEIQIDDRSRYDLVDFLTIDGDRLAALDGPALEKLHRAGFLRLAFAAASSLGNISQLIELKNRARATA
ncbi:MAG TPA: SapC family protein [Sphingomonas sp.]|nr:SapC family protein [Sphingomonas sp.]